MSEFWRAMGWNLAIAGIIAAMVWALGYTCWLRRRPGLEHVLWLLVLVKLVSPPLFVLPILGDRIDAKREAFVEGSSRIGRRGALPITGSPSAPTGEARTRRPTGEGFNFPPKQHVASESVDPNDIRIARVPGAHSLNIISGCGYWAFGLSALGTLVLILRALRSARKIDRLVAAQSPVTTGRVAKLTADVGRAFGLARPAEVVLVSATISPFLWAPWWLARPRIVLSSNFADSLDDDSLRHVLAHEMAHHARRDPLTNGLAFLIAVACWWNPLAWFARRRAGLAAEAGCDAVAIQRLGGSRKAYAQTLLSAVDFLADANAVQPATGTRFGNPSFVKRRIEVIADPKVKARVPAMARVALVAALAGGSFLPVHARTDPSGSEIPSVRLDETGGDAAAFDRAGEDSPNHRKERGPRAVSSNPVLRIEFSMDSRAEGEAGHVVERYLMSKSGETLQVTHISDWAHQAAKTGKLDEKSIGIVLRRVKNLPESPNRKIPPELLTTITLREDEKVTRQRYSRRELPGPLEEVIELLGGLRPRLIGNVRFSKGSEANSTGRQEKSLVSEPIPSDSRIDPQRFARPLTDNDLQELPSTLESLELRGNRSYGIHRLTDEGMSHLAGLNRLRVLDVSGHELTDRALESIAKIDSLEELRIDSNRITGSGLQHLAKLKRLRRLSLNFNPLQPSNFASLGKLKQLVELSVEGTFPITDQVLEHCGGLTELQWLRLSEDMQGVTDRGLSRLTALKQLKNLALKDAVQVSDAGLSHLAELPRLEHLSLRNLHSVTPAGLVVLEQLTELRRLEIVEVRMDEDAVRRLSPLKKLETLVLWSVASEPLPLGVLGDLRSLRDLRTNQPLSRDAIRALGTLNHLESIRDELSTIADEDLAHLARLPNLRFLVLDSDQITVDSLATLAKMKSLRQLFVTRRVKITPQQWRRLGEDTLPRCRIASFFAPYTVYHEASPSRAGDPSGSESRPSEGGDASSIAPPTTDEGS